MGAAAQYVDQRQIGTATVTVISDGLLPIPTSFFPAPQAAWLRAHAAVDAEDRLIVDQAVILIQTGDATILIDPAFDDPDSRWQREFSARWKPRRTPGMAAGMATVRVRPEAITHVVITHAHIDHYAGVLVERDGDLAIRFPNARHFLGRQDWEGNPQRDEPQNDLAIRLGAIDRAGLLQLVDGDQEVARGVTMLHAPGETPGHAVVRLTSAGARFYALGDLCHHACEVAYPDWAMPHADLGTMRVSRERFFSEASASAATVVFTHEPFPPWGRIVRSGDGYTFERA
jgi:glyoxylase-like metal-dependent hydrolase (beta-lactamase superfamily II)